MDRHHPGHLSGDGGAFAALPLRGGCVGGEGAQGLLVLGSAGLVAGPVTGGGGPSYGAARHVRLHLGAEVGRIGSGAGEGIADKVRGGDDAAFGGLAAGGPPVLSGDDQGDLEYLVGTADAPPQGDRGGLVVGRFGRWTRQRRRRRGVRRRRRVGGRRGGFGGCGTVMGSGAQQRVDLGETRWPCSIPVAGTTTSAWGTPSRARVTNRLVRSGAVVVDATMVNPPMAPTCRPRTPAGRPAMRSCRAVSASGRAVKRRSARVMANASPRVLTRRARACSASAAAAV